ncbi:putative Xre family DNA-binding protein [Agrobacterium rubi TR3 = NBRC 13261]|nr:transcriptional regulator with XRE-family HTH domain [Agrobacterium rubi]OCJ51283.1 hypothetical protein A6U92_06580 [Agrobacterium rubi]GAK69923.1 putative Xre family DNA-binding protein [Agrobacterium rubi TR3 = NBRC 13261]
MLSLQCRMARSAVGWDVNQLADAAHVPAQAITRFETGDDIDQPMIDALKAALQSAGVSFIDDNQTSAAGGPGVRLLKSPAEFDTDQSQTVQYPEHLAPDAPTGAGG